MHTFIHIHAFKCIVTLIERSHTIRSVYRLGFELDNRGVGI